MVRAVLLLAVTPGFVPHGLWIAVCTVAFVWALRPELGDWAWRWRYRVGRQRGRLTVPEWELIEARERCEWARPA